MTGQKGTIDLDSPELLRSEMKAHWSLVVEFVDRLDHQKLIDEFKF